MFYFQALYLLVCSIGGIKTEDLCNMLGDINNKEPVAPLYWSQTRRVLKPYIKEIGIEANISFYHMEIYKVNIVKPLFILRYNRPPFVRTTLLQ